MDFGGRTHGRMASIDSDHEMSLHARRPSAPVALGHHLSRKRDSMHRSHPKPPLTPNTSSLPPQNMANPLLPSAPASPPTPAPSPTPHQQSPTSWHLAAGDMVEDPILEEARNIFAGLNITAKETWLRSLVDLCDNHALSLLHQIVSPRLKKDPFKVLPNELCFKVFNSAVWEATCSLLMCSRYSNSLTSPKPLSALYEFQEGGETSLAMIKHGKP